MTAPSALPSEVLAARDRLPETPAAVTLVGARIELRPVEDADFEALHAVSNGQPFTLGERHAPAYDPDREVWIWMHGGPFHDAAALRDYHAKVAAAPDARMLAVCDRASGTPIGIACFIANRPRDLKIELGSIWYGPIAQGTGASRDAAMLMCTHAFELGYRRVEWKCDSRNERSRRAALSYGFTFEGIQDQHMIVKNRNRDTAWFRMLSTEWPAVRARWEAR